MIPTRAEGIFEVEVDSELVLFKQGGSSTADSAMTLNWSGREIWRRCDGYSSIAQIAEELGAQFDVDIDKIKKDVQQTILNLTRFGAISGAIENAGNGITFVVGVEDTPYFWWQLAVLAQSLEDGELPDDWTLHVVICNDFAPLSADVMRILVSYSLTYSEATNHSVSTRVDVGLDGGTGYAALNRIEALRGGANHGNPGRLVCVLDADMFLFGQIQPDIFPKGNSLAFNRHVELTPFFTSEPRNEKKCGVDLAALMNAIGCSTPLVTGAVIVTVERELALEEKFTADCFRFAEAVYLLAKAAGVEIAWLAEMPCFAMALANAGVTPELLTHPQFLVASADVKDLPEGSLFHYFSDPADFGYGGFAGSSWSKQMFRDQNLLRVDLTDFIKSASTDHERYFYKLAGSASDRIYS